MTTWCGPCVAEIPNVRKACDAWHDKGFEVIGVSLDKPDVKDKLQAFVKKNELPWPQYFHRGERLEVELQKLLGEGKT